MEQYEHESERRGLPVEQVVGDGADRRVAFVAITIAAVALVALIVVAVVVGGDGPWWFFGLLALIAAAVLALAVYRARSWFSWGNPQLFLPSSDNLCLGDRVVMRFRRRARGLVHPDEVELTAVLVCEERVRSDGDIATARLLERPVEVTMRGDDGDLVEADLVVEVPLFDAPPTMTLPHHEIAWSLEVRLVAGGAADDDSTFPLVVDPKVSARLLLGAAR